MTKEQAIQLAEKIATGSYSQGELDNFLEFLRFSQPEETSQILDEFLSALDEQKAHQLYVSTDFIDRLRELRPVEVNEVINSEPIIVNKRFSLARVAVAAAVTIAFGLGGYFYFSRIQKNNSTIAADQPIAHDVAAPKNNRATITLANGQKVFLDSAANGTLATQGSIEIKKNGNGVIEYNGNGQTQNELVYNTLTNPRGSKAIDITLSDGTQVWLNAESSLKYPVAFAGNERKVEITGEAYFDVAHDKTKPFTVSKGNKQVQVLGTHFNINAYDDEKNIKVTLLEGSVKILNGDETEIIKPGQQAQVSDKIKIINGIDTAVVMAWKNGIFLFDKTDVQLTMSQVARWYDVDIEYQGNVTGSFSGTIKRQENASQVLKMLALTGEVQFKIEGKKIIVEP